MGALLDYHMFEQEYIVKLSKENLLQHFKNNI